MKYLYFTIISLALFACSGSTEKQLDADIVNNPISAEDTSSKEGVPMIVFDKDLHDFGRVYEGEKVTYAFRFQNTGTGDLIIRSASGSCGCTVPEYPKAPIKPGGEGYIRVSFDSRGRIGHNEKQVTLIANTIPNNTVIAITADVTEK